VAGSGLRSCPIADFGINGVDASGCTPDNYSIS